MLDSCTNYKLYCDKAADLGQTAICFTEHGNIYNNIEKKMYANKKGLKYLHGVEIYLTYSLENKVRDNYHTILIAKNKDGIKELNLLVDLATREDHMYYKPRISFEEFFNISKNIIKISACLASPLSKYPKIALNIDTKIQEIIDKAEQEAKKISLISEDYYAEFIYANANETLPNFELWQKYEIEKIIEARDKEIDDLKRNTEINARKTFERLLQSYDYYEIQPHKSLEQIQYNRMLYEASKKYNIPLIAGTDTHSINQYKAECRSILQKAKHIEFSNEDEFDLTYKSYDELVEMFRQQGSLPMEVVLEAIENTNRMADSVMDYELDIEFKYPILYENEEKVFVERIYKMYQDKLDKGIIKPNPKYEENIQE